MANKKQKKRITVEMPKVLVDKMQKDADAQLTSVANIARGIIHRNYSPRAPQLDPIA